MTRVGLPHSMPGSITVAGTGLKCEQSGIFLSGFAFFGTSSYIFGAMPVSCLRCDDSWVRRSASGPALGEPHAGGASALPGLPTPDEPPAPAESLWARWAVRRILRVANGYVC